MSKEHGSNGIREEYVAIPTTYTNGNKVGKPKDSKKFDLYKWLKIISTGIGIIAAIAGTSWAVANLMLSFSTKDDNDRLKERVEIVEKSDVAQTVILENIKESIDRIEHKIDKILEK